MGTKICTFLLLLLGLTLPALSDKCPDHDRLPTTCECEDEFVDDEVDVELSCSSSTMGDLEDALRLMDKNSRLEIQLDDMKLGYMHHEIFDGLNVVKLDISHCELDGLSTPGYGLFKGLEDKLEVLAISASFTEEKGPQILQFLQPFIRLREIDFSYNALNEVPDYWLSSPPPALTHLSLSNNGIVKLGERAFQKLANLESLELHGNRFGPIKRSMLPRPANRLERLELDNNAFTSVPDDLFTDMPELKELSIRTNQITQLQKPAFKLIWSQLDSFDARGNPLQCDSSMEWLFHVRTGASLILGTCEGPDNREGMELENFIQNKGE